MKIKLFLFSAILFAACSFENSGISNSVNTKTLCPESLRGSFIDSRDGQSYVYTQIGEQVWMAENLNYNAIAGGSCLYADEVDCKLKGQVYHFSEAVNACPSGWHLPTKEDWDLLIDNMGGSSKAATALKATSGWRPFNPGENTNGSDDCGFTAIAVGSISKSQYLNNFDDFRTEIVYDFEYEGYEAEWWGIEDSVYSTTFTIKANNKVLSDNKSSSGTWYSVRCLKD